MGTEKISGPALVGHQRVLPGVLVVHYNGDLAYLVRSLTFQTLLLYEAAQMQERFKRIHIENWMKAKSQWTLRDPSRRDVMIGPHIDSCGPIDMGVYHNVASRSDGALNIPSFTFSFSVTNQAVLALASSETRGSSR